MSETCVGKGGNFVGDDVGHFDGTGVGDFVGEPVVGKTVKCWRYFDVSEGADVVGKGVGDDVGHFDGTVSVSDFVGKAVGDDP